METIIISVFSGLLSLLDILIAIKLYKKDKCVPVGLLIPLALIPFANFGVLLSLIGIWLDIYLKEKYHN